MASFFQNWIDITPTADGTYKDIDLSSYIPVGTTGVVIRNSKNTLGNLAFAIRRYGATDDLYNYNYDYSQATIYVGVSSDRKIQVKRQVGDGVNRCYLTGYFESEAVFLPTRIEYTPSVGSWQTTTLTELPAGGNCLAIFEVCHSGASTLSTTNFRRTGSTDNRIGIDETNECKHYGFIVGTNSSKQCDIYKGHSNNNIYLIGYIRTDYAAIRTNGIDLNVAATGLYQDKDLDSYDTVPTGALAAIIEVSGSTVGVTFDVRPNGGDDLPHTTNLYDGLTGSHLIKLDADNIIEVKVNHAATDFLILGYVLSGTPTVPVANFIADTTTGNPPLTVIFTDISTGIPNYWEWNFGDGSALDHTQNPSHIYSSMGNYTVTLTVSNALGWDSEVKVAYITINNVGTALLTFPALTGLVESWGVNLTIPMFQIGAGGYWTDYTLMTFPMFELQASGYVISNDGLVTFPALTISASGLVGVVGSAELILPALELSAGQPPLAGANIILPLFEISASGSVMQTGSAILTLPPLALTGTGLTGLYGNASLILPPFTTYGIGIVHLNITGDALLILPSLKLNATGNIVYAETYQVFAINTKNMAISNYTNYPYNSFAKFGNLYLASSSNGIYLLEGTKDETANINTKFSTGLMGMGLDKLKRVIDMILGIKSNGKYDLKVTTDDGIESTYELTDASSVPHPVRRKFGKGQRGKYWKLKIYNKEGSDFEIDSIQSTVDTMSRRV